MKSVSAIVYHEHGNPAEVVRVEQQELPDLKPGDVRIRILAAPINPADLNTIEGKYPIRPPLPAVPGVEGSGVVESAGREVTHVNVGDEVLLPHGLGTWREACVCPAHGVVAVPEGIDPVTAAMLKINPATAWRMLHDFAELKPGDWLAQNAANSGVGRAVIEIAHHLGLRTVNIVRRESLVPELEALGADAVLLDTADLRKEIPARTGGAKIQLALNAVGGESALAVANSLAPHGTHVTYGAMAMQPVRVPNGLLIFKDIRFRGFWVTKWYEESTAPARQEMFKQLFKLAARGLLKSKVEKEYPIAAAKEAIQRAQQGSREGKIIFRVL
ncbi:MAG TPA: 2-enoyl thioester reductase domain-containing protein [Chthoniobacteraceae bacterium]|nr:2-enoyl thioester reductase domain-containing protein [Chthoniobacteraceae bacterium]